MNKIKKCNLVNKNNNLKVFGLSCKNPVKKERKKTITKNYNLKRKGILD